MADKADIIILILNLAVLVVNVLIFIATHDKSFLNDQSPKVPGRNLTIETHKLPRVITATVVDLARKLEKFVELIHTETEKTDEGSNYKFTINFDPKKRMK